MRNEDLSVLLLLIVTGLSIWLTVMFVLLCGRVKAIKSILMAAYDVEEFVVRGGVAYRKKRTILVEEESGPRPNFLSLDRKA
jgi:hypothetical protein